MKLVLGVLVAGSSLIAQAQAGNPRAACGNGDLPFTIKLAAEAPQSSAPEEGKALVFFIQDAGNSAALAYPTTRIGIDGSWVGANKESSYTALTMEPGAHHACIMTQSSFVDELIELAPITVEAGKTYYFRTRLFLSNNTGYLELMPINSDQGWYLVNSLPRSVTKGKK